VIDTFSSLAEVLGGGYASSMGSGGGQDLNQMTGPGSGMSMQQLTLPGMIPGQMRMLGNQHVPMHIINQQHLKYNPPVYRGPLGFHPQGIVRPQPMLNTIAMASHRHVPTQMVNQQHNYNPTVYRGQLNSTRMGFHQPGMVRPQPRLSTMVTHTPPHFANQMARMPFQSTLLPGMTGGIMSSVQQPANPSPAAASLQDSLLASFLPSLRNPPETTLSPQQQSQVPPLTAEHLHTKPPPPQLQQTPPQTQVLPPPSGHNLPSMSQPSSLPQPQQPAATPTPQTQIQQPQGPQQTQQEEFGSLSMVADPHPRPTAQLPGTQPQTATLNDASPLQGQVSERVHLCYIVLYLTESGFTINCLSGVSCP